MRRVEYLIAGLLGLLVGEGYLLLITKRSDFGTYYDAARAIGQGANPYILDFNYRQLPLWAWLLQPLGQLPFGRASIIWLLLSFGALVASGLLTFAAFGWPRDRARVVWLLAFLTAPPTLLCLLYGQASAFVLLAFSTALFVAKRDRYELAGLVLGLAVIKPQLALLVAPALLAMPVRAWLGFLVTVAAWVALSAITGGPALIASFVERITTLSAALTLEKRPTVFGLVSTFVPEPALVNWLLAGVLLILLAWLAFARLSGKPFPLTTEQSTLAAALLTPYMLVYDFVVLFPIYLAVVCARPLSWRWQLASLAFVWTLPVVTSLSVWPLGIISGLDALTLVLLLVATKGMGGGALSSVDIAGTATRKEGVRA